MKMEYTKNELKYFIIIILALTFAFAFNDKSAEFAWSSWLVNFFKTLVFVAVSVFVHDFAHDLAAKKYGFISEYRVWGIKRLGWHKESFPRTVRLFGREIEINSFPLGIILCILIAIVSNGKLFFTAVSSYGLMIKRTQRFGHKIIEVTDFEEAKIALAGPMANIALAIVFKLVSPDGLFADMVLINSVMPVYDMLPFFGLDGMKVLAGSKALYVFGFLFIVGMAVLMHYLSALPALLVALALTVIFFLIYLWRSIAAK